MKVEIYRFDASVEKLNELAKQNWEVQSESPFLIGIPFDIKDGPHLDNYKSAMEGAANLDKETRKVLTDAGFKIKECADGFVITDYSPIYRWTLQFCPQDEDGMCYITNINPNLGFPLIAIKKEIDKYVPKSIIRNAVLSKAIIPDEIEIDGQEETHEIPIQSQEEVHKA